MHSEEHRECQACQRENADLRKAIQAASDEGGANPDDASLPRLSELEGKLAGKLIAEKSEEVLRELREW